MGQVSVVEHLPNTTLGFALLQLAAGGAPLQPLLMSWNAMHRGRPNAAQETLSNHRASYEGGSTTITALRWEVKCYNRRLGLPGGCRWGVDQLQSSIPSDAKYLFTFNEPNHLGQSEVWPKEAAVSHQRRSSD